MTERSLDPRALRVKGTHEVQVPAIARCEDECWCSYTVNNSISTVLTVPPTISLPFLSHRSLFKTLPPPFSNRVPTDSGHTALLSCPSLPRLRNVATRRAVDH